MRTEFRHGRSITEPKAFAARIQLGQEVADVLKKNIVQAVKVENQDSEPPSSYPTVKDDEGVWSECKTAFLPFILCNLICMVLSQNCVSPNTPSSGPTTQ